MRNCIVFVVMCVFLSGCATTSEYASASSQNNYQKSCAIVDSESAFRCMNKPKINGDKILFTGPGQNGKKYDVFIINKDGTEFRNLTNSPDIDENYAYWTYDGKIAYMEAEFDYYANGTRMLNHAKDRKVMNDDGTGVITISPELYDTIIKK